jgi:tetratricopeptide (TPR) repeat protein
MSAIKPLVLHAKAFVKMINWMAEYANFNKIMQPNWVEAMGIMFCKTTPEKYIIADAAGITYGNLVYVETSPQQVAEITRIEDRLRKEDANIYAGGWFHSHPGHSLFFSGTDLANQTYWQTSNPNGVGLVFDLMQVSDVFIGFKFFRLDADNPQTYIEVPYELYGFTEDTLIEAFKPVGIDIKTIHRLAKYLGLKGKEGIVEFDKIEVPETDDPIGTAKSCINEGKKVYFQGNVNKAIQLYRVANLLLKDNTQTPEDMELYLNATLKLAKLCVLNDFPDTAELLLKKEVIVFATKMDLNPDLYIGKAEILLGYLGDINHKPEDALYHYKKAIELFTNKKYYEGLYKAYDLAGGASWKFYNKDDAIQYFKDALYNVMLAEKADKDKREQRIWDLIKKGLSSKITSAEGSPLGPPAIEKVE